MEVPFNINKYAKKDPEEILFENLYEKSLPDNDVVIVKKDKKSVWNKE